MFPRYFTLRFRPHFANQNIFIYSPSTFLQAAQVMGHALDYYSEQHCGTDLLTCTLLMTQLDWDGLGWLVKGMCPAGEIASVSFLISSFTKSVPAGFRSQLWPEPRNNNRKESYRDTATLSAFYEGLEIKWVSQAQHVGPRKGDCLPASSKTLLSMAMLPHRHKYKTKKKLRQGLESSAHQGLM